MGKRSLPVSRKTSKTPSYGYCAYPCTACTLRRLMPYPKLRRQYNLRSQRLDILMSAPLPLLSKDRTRLWFIEALGSSQRRRWDFDVGRMSSCLNMPMFSSSQDKRNTTSA